MIINPQVPFHRLVLSMAQAMDCVHKEIANHQLRVAYTSTHIARAMGYKGQGLLEVFVAAAFHDIGMVRSDNRVQAVHYNNLEGLAWHAEAGWELLRDQPLFADAAGLIRRHHTPWRNGQGAECDGQTVALGSHIIHLADEVDRVVRRDAPILEQRDAILKRLVGLGGHWLHPECLEVFRDLAQAESFWLDCVSEQIYGILLRQVDWPALTLDEAVIKPIAEVLGRLVDAGSGWTATHSAGVTATAVALSARLGFSPREQALLRAAGYLHDLGKLTIPAAILDKPGRLTAEESLCMRGHTYHTFRILDTIGGMPQVAEWAAFHHERLDGAGYPFHHKGRDLTLGSRIMTVADVFAAVAEDRPYRKGMSRPETLGVLDKLVGNGGLDGDVVAVLGRDFAAINDVRIAEQAQYAAKQAHLTKFLKHAQAASPGRAVSLLS